MKRRTSLWLLRISEFSYSEFSWPIPEADDVGTVLAGQIQQVFPAGKQN